MTYIESALYDFVKSILTRGIRTLKDPRYFQYSIFLLLVVVVGTISAFTKQLYPSTITGTYQDLLLYVELSVAIGFVIVGILLGRVNVFIQMISIVVITGALTSVLYFDIIPDPVNVASTTAAVFYLVWIGIASFSTFSLFRDLFDNDLFGTILFLGKPEDDGRVMFSLIGWLLAFLNLGMGYFIYQNGMDQGSNSLVFTSLAIMLFALIAMIPLLNLQKKHDVFYTVITTFFMFTTIRVILLAFRSLTSTPGNTSYWDTLFSMFIALYAIQNAAVKGIKIGETDEDDDLSIEEQTLKESEGLGIVKLINRLLSDRGIILVILGTVIGFHTMQVQTIMGRTTLFQYFIFTQDADIVLLGYQANITISLFIYIVAMLLFLLFPPFQRYANPEVKRIPWAPPYEDLKLLISKIKDDEISWKGDLGKLMTGVAMDKLKSKFGRKDTSGSRIQSAISNLLKKAKEEEEEED